MNDRVLLAVVICRIGDYCAQWGKPSNESDELGRTKSLASRSLFRNTYGRAIALVMLNVGLADP